MTAAERRRIDVLIQTVTEALDEPAPPETTIEAVALRRRLDRLSRRGQRAVIAAVMLEDTVAVLKAHEAQDKPAKQYYAEVEAAKRWALETGRAARQPRHRR